MHSQTFWVMHLARYPLPPPPHSAVAMMWWIVMSWPERVKIWGKMSEENSLFRCLMTFTSFGNSANLWIHPILIVSFWCYWLCMYVDVCTSASVHSYKISSRHNFTRHNVTLTLYACMYVQYVHVCTMWHMTLCFYVYMCVYCSLCVIPHDWSTLSWHSCPRVHSRYCAGWTLRCSLWEAGGCSLGEVCSARSALLWPSRDDHSTGGCWWQLKWLPYWLLQVCKINIDCGLAWYYYRYGLV